MRKTKNREYVRLTTDLAGIVQGVGMRPALYRLATQAGLGGWVQNCSGGVRLSLVGPQAAIEVFLHGLAKQLPPNARIDSMSPPLLESLPNTIKTIKTTSSPTKKGVFYPSFPKEESARSPIEKFRILKSGIDGGLSLGIPADLAMCRTCLTDIIQLGNRRYGYPFTTCSHCGPRYSVVHDMPYDRENTTLKLFPLCSACQQDYKNPQNHRFHAESIACPQCGPQLSLRDAGGNIMLGGTGESLQQVRQALRLGKIVAVRGLGGFLLVVDASNPEAIQRLRQKKHRPHKPFAVMVQDVDTLHSHGWSISPELQALLTGPTAPIVILDNPPKAVASQTLALQQLSPDSATLGFMLPTTPLQWLLFAPLLADPKPTLDFLLMTSGNHQDEPMCTSNAEALERLAGIADLFLCHNREIYRRVDDSVCVYRHGTSQVWRRARGYAPMAIRLQQPLQRRVLAMGAELKNTVAVGFADQVIMSAHVGNLHTLEAVLDQEQVIRHLLTFLQQKPQVIAVDLHPDMHATLLGYRLAAEWHIPVVAVQHHHAHALACMAEHGLKESLALVFDGAGFGGDGTIWGAELLHIYPGGWQRLGTFVPVPLPGGDVAVRQPARQLLGRFVHAGVKLVKLLKSRIWQQRLGITVAEARMWEQQCRTRVNAPSSHAAGRLFDAFSAALGLAPAILTYEGQAAIRLEAAAKSWLAKSGSTDVSLPDLSFTTREHEGLFLVDWAETFQLLSIRLPQEHEIAGWAYAFHQSVVLAAEKMLLFGVAQTALDTVVVSGGVFMNSILTDLLSTALQNRGFYVYTHHNIPPNDGGISLGQALMAGRIS